MTSQVSDREGVLIYKLTDFHKMQDHLKMKTGDHGGRLGYKLSSGGC